MEFGHMTDRDGAWPRSLAQNAIEELADDLPGHPPPRLHDWTGATPVIDDRQDSKRPPIGERIMHKIHTPTLAGTGRHRRGAAMQGHVLATSHPHPQLQSIQAGTTDGPTSGSRASPLVAATPKYAGTHSAVESGRNLECADGAPTDSSLDCGGTRRLD